MRYYRKKLIAKYDIVARIGKHLSRNLQDEELIVFSEDEGFAGALERETERRIENATREDDNHS